MYKAKKKYLHFGISVIWCEPRNHGKGCYLCSCNMQSYNSQNEREIFYLNLPSSVRPVTCGPDVPVPTPLETLDTVSFDLISDVNRNSERDSFQPESSSEPQRFT